MRGGGAEDRAPRDEALHQPFGFDESGHSTSSALSFPLPACGERVATCEALSRVMGNRQYEVPLTRTAARRSRCFASAFLPRTVAEGDLCLSPQAGRGEKKRATRA